MKLREISKKKKAAVICGAAVFVIIIAAVVFLIVRKDYAFMIKEYLGIGKKQAEVVLMKETDSEKVVPGEFSERENVSFNQSMMLVNQENRLPEDFSEDICEYKDTGVMMNSCMCESYGRMSADIIDRFSQKLFVMSSFRTAEEQQELISDGSSDKVAEVGASEHRTGLALDVYVSGFAGEGFIKSEVGRWVNENAHKYGFIIRYPIGKSDVTGIKYEPWHIRFVGYPHSEIMYRSSLTLEEYLDSIRCGEFYSYHEYVITKQKPDGDGRITVPTGLESYVISEDNRGNFIITGKK